MTEQPPTEEQHPTQKPVGLLKAILNDYAEPGSVVLDPFHGSGSTLIACERIGLTCGSITVPQGHQGEPTVNDPGIGLLEAKGPKQKKDRTDFGTPPKAPKKALVKAGEEHETGRPGQGRIDGSTQAKALEDYKELAADYGMKAQRWKDAQEMRDVRLGDLVKVHAHKPFDDASAARVSKDTAKAVEREKKAQEAKADAKKALDAAWATVQSFSDSEPVRPLIPDDE